jgi:hypothetical protein
MEPERGQPEPEPLTPPGELRPAHMAVVLNTQFTLGHLGLTLIDLVQRGLLSAERAAGRDSAADPYDYEPVGQESPDGQGSQDRPDWVLADQRGSGRPPPGYRFETLLLDSLFAGPSPLRLSELTPETVRGLGPVEDALLGDMRNWHWLSSTGDYLPRLTGHGREVRRKIWAFKKELSGRVQAGQDVSGLPQYVALFGLAPEPDPLLTSWLVACDHYRDPEFTKPDRSVADEPVRVFYLNWVAPPGYRRENPFRHHDGTGLAEWAAGVEEHPPDEPSRLVRWLRAVRLATRRN